MKGQGQQWEQEWKHTVMSDESAVYSHISFAAEPNNLDFDVAGAQPEANVVVTVSMHRVGVVLCVLYDGQSSGTDNIAVRRMVHLSVVWVCFPMIGRSPSFHGYAGHCPRN